MRTERKNLKAEQLEHWRNLEAGQDPMPHMRVIPYKSEGSRYGACGIRIDGNPAFIDAVLSNLKTVLAGENGHTRLELARHKVDGSGIGKALNLADDDAEVVYIRLHERGGEAQMMNAFVEGARRRTAARAELAAQGLN
jgi:hypothetical protein